MTHRKAQRQRWTSPVLFVVRGVRLWNSPCDLHWNKCI
jgi:hypothetical protein